MTATGGRGAINGNLTSALTCQGVGCSSRTLEKNQKAIQFSG
jgi:hypothetical protein